MARIEDGILGSFSGKFGEIVTSSWNGIPYVKSRPASYHDAKTPAQLSHRMKLQLAHLFVKSIKECIEAGFRQVAERQSPYNKAVSYMMKNAIVGEYPSMRVEPEKVALSQGDLAGAKECSAAKDENGRVVFSWSVDCAELEKSHAKSAASRSASQKDDDAWLVAYNFSRHEAKIACSNRGMGHDTIAIPDAWNGDEIGCYIFFASNKSNKVSDTLFIGMV